MKFKAGDVYFDEEGTFLRILSISNTHVRYAIKYSDELVYDVGPDCVTTIEGFPFELAHEKYIKYTRAARLLYGKF